VVLQYRPGGSCGIDMLRKWRRFWHEGLPPESPAAYLFAVGCIAVATLARYALASVTSAVIPFALYYPAILVATLVAGPSAGAVASFVGGIIVWATIALPSFGLTLDPTSRVVTIVVYALSCGLIICVAESYRRAIRRLDKTEQTRLLLLREFEHRNRNTLAVAQAIVSQSLRENRQEAERINGRIRAFAATSDLVVRSDDQTADLRDVLLAELKPYDERRIVMQGAAVALGANLAQSLALIFHELATNAAKYGALSTTEGHISIFWSSADDFVRITWVEKDGPAVMAPTTRGFGLYFIERILDSAQGEVATEFRPDGLMCQISFASGHAGGHGASPTKAPSYLPSESPFSSEQ
jgi:two-component sensor histidine kinase